MILIQVRGMVMTKGDKVAWNILGWGSGEGYHPVHFHGQTLRHKSAKQFFKGDVFEVLIDNLA